MRVTTFPESLGFEPGRKPLYNWCEGLEEGARTQALNLTRLPFTFHHVALMPDAHQGYGMPIGGVLATGGAVVPNAVGVDIGCGMRAWNTGVHAEDVNLAPVMEAIARSVPVGFRHHEHAQNMDTLTEMSTMLIAPGEAWDEAPGAYKDIESVMAAQADLVEVTETLKPLAVIKG